MHLDVTSEDAWAAAVDRAEAAFGRLDVLVNNAGIGIPPHPLLETTLEGHHRTIDVNLHGVWLGMRAAAPALRRAGGGSIVNISSIDGIVGVSGMASYTASKFAVTGLTKSAALEWGRDGIRVNSVHPGVISSPMVEQAPPEVLARLQQYLDHQPIPRMGTPEEVALPRALPRVGRVVVLHRQRVRHRRWPHRRPVARAARLASAPWRRVFDVERGWVRDYYDAQAGRSQSERLRRFKPVTAGVGAGMSHPSAERPRELGGTMARTDTRSGIAGIGVGGALVIAGIIIALFWSVSSASSSRWSACGLRRLRQGQVVLSAAR